MPDNDDCGAPGCYGFSCPVCRRCTAECPNMACCREPAVEPAKASPVEGGRDGR